MTIILCTSHQVLTLVHHTSPGALNSELARCTCRPCSRPSTTSVPMLQETNSRARTCRHFCIPTQKNPNTASCFGICTGSTITQTPVEDGLTSKYLQLVGELKLMPSYRKCCVVTHRTLGGSAPPTPAAAPPPLTPPPPAAAPPLAVDTVVACRLPVAVDVTCTRAEICSSRHSRDSSRDR